MKKIPLVLVLLACMGNSDCGSSPVSASGVSKATVKVPVGTDGMTSEQRNVRDRLVEDNKPGAVKHLYIISAYSGQVIFYSTVRGKVTSGGKRLTPTTVIGDGPNTNSYFNVNIGDSMEQTAEVLQDDGTYGYSSEYLYWWDTQGRYYQYYITGGVIPIISTQPMAVKSIILNMEVTKAPNAAEEMPPVPLPQ